MKMQVAIRVAMKKCLSPPVKPAHHKLFGDRVAMVAISIYLTLNIATTTMFSNLKIFLAKIVVSQDKKV
jgi:hypothetical protein